MDNKKLGIIIIGISIILFILLFVIRTSLVALYESEVEQSIEKIGTCHAENEECPHEKLLNIQIPIFIAGALLIGVMSLGAYLIFFEKSQKEIVAALRKQERIQLAEEKFNILLKGLDPDEQKVIKAVREQNGITQQTLRLRADMHKSKLSIVLDRLEKKDLLKRVAKGKTKQVFLKIAI